MKEQWLKGVGMCAEPPKPPIITQGERRGQLLKQQAERRYAHQVQYGGATGVDIYSGGRSCVLLHPGCSSTCPNELLPMPYHG